MAWNLAARMSDVRASEIREILKVTGRPGIISFAGGLPAPELFPVAELEAVTADILREMGPRALQYSTTEGHPPLREGIAHRLRDRKGIDAATDEVLVTTGSQQGLDLAGKLFLDEGDGILCESPTYLGAIQAFRVFRPRFLEARTDEGGIVIDDVERLLASGRRIRLAYVVPEFQNPSGRSWTLERRERFLEAVARHGIPVVEDDPYGELRFEGEGTPPLKALDRNGQVIYLGTFSKIFCPGLRIAWLAAARPLVEKFVLLKQGTDLHTSTLGQMQVAAYLERHDIDAAIARLREVYRRRRDAMVAAIEREFPPDVLFTRPRGGLFLWVELPGGLRSRDLLARCLERDVAFVPGDPFFPNGGREDALRLNFSNAPERLIEEGIERMGAALREMRGRERRSPVI